MNINKRIIYLEHNITSFVIMELSKMINLFTKAKATFSGISKTKDDECQQIAHPEYQPKRLHPAVLAPL